MTALWDGLPRHIEADEADSTPFVGMRMLERRNLSIDVENGAASPSRRWVSRTTGADTLPSILQASSSYSPPWCLLSFRTAADNCCPVA